MMLTQFFKNVGKHIDKLRLMASFSCHNIRMYTVDW